MVYEADSDLVVGVVGEMHSGKNFTVFGMNEGETSLDLREEMKGVLPRIIEDLMAAEYDLNVSVQKV